MRRAHLLLPASLAAILIPAAATAQIAPPPGSPIVIDKTATGQPIRAPAGDLRVTISQRVLPPGGGLPVHKHPFPRVVTVLSGHLRVTNLDTGDVKDLGPGEWAVDSVDQWHEGKVIGDEPVRLLAIDQAPPGAAVTIPKQP